MNVWKMFKASREMVCLGALFTATCCFAQSDPGPRAGAAGAGTPIGGLTPGELDFFTNHGIPQFSQVEAVADGLGPRFNLDSCGGCHIQPALGGSSPAVNPQLARASAIAPGNGAFFHHVERTSSRSAIHQERERQRGRWSA